MIKFKVLDEIIKKRREMKMLIRFFDFSFNVLDAANRWCTKDQRPNSKIYFSHYVICFLGQTVRSLQAENYSGSL